AVSLSGATLAGGASCTFSVNVTGTSAGVKNNSVTVSSVDGGTGNTSNASITVVAPANLSKSFGAPSVPLNGSTSLSFTVTNLNASVALSGVGFTDALPTGLVVSTPNGLTGSCGGATITAVAGTSTVILSGATLAAGANCTFSVNVTGKSAGTKVNTTSVVSSAEGGNGAAATATLIVVGPPVIAKSFGATNIALNGSTTLSFTITNPNASSALSGVGFTDTLPAGLVVSTPNGLTGSCGGGAITATAGSGAVSLVGATLAANASCTFSVNVTGTTAGTKLNSVTVASTSGGTGNTANASLSVALPPQIAKSFGSATVARGGSTSLSFTIGNPNTAFGLTGIAFTDSLPAGLVVATPSGLTGSCGGGSINATAGSGAVSLSGATLAGGASCTFSVNVTGTSAGVKNNSVTVSAANAGVGNTSNASVTVVVPPTLTKAFGAASIPFGGSTTLAFTVTNPNSTITLHGVGFTDALPTGLVVSTPNGLTGSCGGATITAVAGTNTVILSGAVLAAGASCTFSANVTAVAVGIQTNTTSTVSSTEGGSGTAATATLTVTRAPTTTTVVAVPTSAGFGSPITFTATVAPSGPNGSGVDPTGTVSFFVDGSATPLATVALAGSQASFTTAGLGVGTHTVAASYSGDTNFLPSSSTTPAAVTVTCTATITGLHSGSLVLGAGATCLSGATVTGSIVVPRGALLDIENSTVTGAVIATGSGDIRICGTAIGASVTIQNAIGFVVVGDLPDGCAPNHIAGSLTLRNNTGGVQAIGNYVGGTVIASGNSGAGPFPGDTAPVISGNGH
ncbi:MAG: Ig-like domain-containing protein, partial [Actinomycetota bacterium]|nr:Ig-like domain-containing protein [Actinomycetota bacterium]